MGTFEDCLLTCCEARWDNFRKGSEATNVKITFFFLHFYATSRVLKGLQPTRWEIFSRAWVEKLDGLTNTWRLESRAWQEFSIGKVQFGGRTKLHEVPFAIGYIVRSCDTVYARARTRDCNGRVMLMNES